MQLRPFAIEAGLSPTIADLAPLFAEREIGRYCADWTLPAAGARALEAESLHALLSQPETVAFYATSGSTLVGVLAARPSEWDTRFWGFSYAILETLLAVGETEARRRDILGALVEALDHWLTAERVRFVAARVLMLDLAATHALEQRGYRYVETTLANSIDLRGEALQLPAGYAMRAPRPEEGSALARMTEGAFVTQRFHADPGFPRAKVDQMYVAWVESSLASPAWSTVVLDHEGVAKGFVIYRVQDHTRHLGVKITVWRMAALGGEDRARGHGIPLLRGAIERVRGECDIVESTLTLRNTKSFNIHAKLGFRALAFSSTFHKWL